MEEAFEKWINGEEPYFPPHDLHYKMTHAAWNARQPEIDALKAEVEQVTADKVRFILNHAQEVIDLKTEVEERKQYVTELMNATRYAVALECYEMVFSTIDESKAMIAEHFGLDVEVSNV